MKDLSLVILCLSAFVANGEYQPGTPGKTWDADEIRVVRNKVNISKSISYIYEILQSTLTLACACLDQ